MNAQKKQVTMAIKHKHVDGGSRSKEADQAGEVCLNIASKLIGRELITFQIQ